MNSQLLFLVHFVTFLVCFPFLIWQWTTFICSLLSWARNHINIIKKLSKSNKYSNVFSFLYKFKVIWKVSHHYSYLYICIMYISYTFGLEILRKILSLIIFVSLYVCTAACHFTTSQICREKNAITSIVICPSFQTAHMNGQQFKLES